MPQVNRAGGCVWRIGAGLLEPQSLVHRQGALHDGHAIAQHFAIACRARLADRPLEQFLLLNGLDKDAALKPGVRYKIVVE